MKTEIAKEMLRIVQTRLNNRGVLKPIEYKTLEICCGILNGYAIVEKCDELVRQGEMMIGGARRMKNGKYLFFITQP